MHRHIVAALISLAAAGSALAQVSVDAPWVRATVPQQKATGAFMVLTAAKDAKLVSAASPVANVVEIHEMTMVDSVMKMRALPKGLDLPAGTAVELKPGGYHVMLIDLKHQINAGDIVPLTLTVQGKDGKTDTIELKAPAKPLNAKPAADKHQH